MGGFKQLTVWKRSRVLTIELYRVTSGFPQSESNGLVSQIRRAAVSVAANIAESCGRHSGRDQVRSYRIALGSARELESLVLIAGDLQFVNELRGRGLASASIEIQKMLSGLIQHCLQASSAGASVTNSRLKSSV